MNFLFFSPFHTVSDNVADISTLEYVVEPRGLCNILIKGGGDGPTTPGLLYAYHPPAVKAHTMYHPCRIKVDEKYRFIFFF
jgi:hypothetical protein